MITDEQMAKLPKWAQDEMKRLEMRNRELQDKVAALTDAPPSPVGWSDGIHEANNLPPRARVIFKQGEEWDETIEVSMTQRGDVEVRSARAILIKPVAGNVVIARLEQK